METVTIFLFFPHSLRSLRREGDSVTDKFLAEIFHYPNSTVASDMSPFFSSPQKCHRGIRSLSWVLFCSASWRIIKNLIRSTPTRRGPRLRFATTTSFAATRFESPSLLSFVLLTRGEGDSSQNHGCLFHLRFTNRLVFLDGSSDFIRFKSS